MKKILLALAVIGTLAAAPAFAADDNGGAFINGNVGQSNLSKGGYNDNSTGYGANIGYRWAINPQVALGLEGGYTDLGKFDAKNSRSDLGTAQVQGWTLGVNGHFNFTPHWYASARAGYFRSEEKGFTNDTVAVHVNDHSDKYYAGVGVGYDFDNHLSAGINYDYYKADKSGLNLDPDLVSIGAEYRF